MKWISLLTFFILIGCQSKNNTPISSVNIETLYESDSSVRALTTYKNHIYFADHHGHIGTISLTDFSVQIDSVPYSNEPPAFRSIAVNSQGVYALSIENPALLYKADPQGQLTLVYKEASEGVFYDALHFANDSIGYAFGDNYDGCMSVLNSIDGGLHWEKVSCDLLPASEIGEGAFAASNTNIESHGAHVWMATTQGKVYRKTHLETSLMKHSQNGTKDFWEAVQTPLVSDSATHGIYSMDFYDENTGVIYGGDYTQPTNNKNNFAITTDGGTTWNLIADGSNLGYKSCVQFVPDSNATQLVVVGFTGIGVSNNGGNTWISISDEGFYTLRFIDRNTAIAAGKNRIAKLEFK